MNLKNLKEFIDKTVKELLKNEFHLKKEAYTGVKGTEKDEPKGGSAAFEKNRKKVISYDKKHRPKGPEDLEEEQ